MMGSKDGGHLGRRLLVIAATLLIVGGALLTLSAPNSPLVNNKADAYGTAIPTKPTNPKTKTECTKYYGTTNLTPESRECQAQVTHYSALKRCSKKNSASARRSCKRAANTAFAKAKTRIAAQRKAEKACNETYTAASTQLNSEDPEYAQKSGALLTSLTSCLKKARS
jgi:hypothetical protein